MRISCAASGIMEQLIVINVWEWRRLCYMSFEIVEWQVLFGIIWFLFMVGWISTQVTLSGLSKNIGANVSLDGRLA
jgi:hypothetical protein